MSLNTFDDLLTALGTGRWNLLIFFVASFMDFIIPLQILSGTFTSPLLPFTCKLPPEFADIDVSAEDLEDKCEVHYNTTVNGHVESHTHTCQQFTFDTSTFQSTMTSEFGLVCGYGFMRATFFSLYNVGNLIGSPLTGIISDKRGRRTTLVFGAIVYIGASISTAFLPSMSLVFVARFLNGLTHACLIQSGFLLATEVCEPKHRSTVGILVALPWAIGTMIWGALGYLIRDWRYLQMAGSIPGIIIIPFLFFIDESPRWLIVTGRFDEAIAILDRAARWNKKILPPKEELLTLMKRIQKESTSSTSAQEGEKGIKVKCKNIVSGLFIFFTSKNLRKRTLILFFDFFVCSMVFYGMSINAVNFSADPYMYMILGGLMEVPSYSLTAPIIQKFGRKPPTICGYLISGCAILALTFIPSDFKGVVMTLALIGKLTIASCYQIIYLFCAELIPTEVRQFGIGCCNVVARIGSIICPYIVDVMGPIYPWMPSAIFGTISIVCGLATFTIPETLNKPIPETLADLEDKPKKDNYKPSDAANSSELENL